MSVKYWKGGMAGFEGDFDVAMVSDTLDASAITDLGGTINKVRIAITAHSFNLYDWVVILGTTYYDGNFRIVGTLTNSIDIIHSYTAETPAGTETITSSNWQDEWGVSVSPPIGNDTIIFDDKAMIADDKALGHREGDHYSLLTSIGVADTGGLDFYDVFVDDSFRGNIGIDSYGTISAFHLSIADGYGIQVKAEGLFYFECSHDNATQSTNIPLFVMDSRNGYCSLASNVNDALYTSTWDKIIMKGGGNLDIVADTWFATLEYHSNGGIVIVGEDCVEVADSDDLPVLYLRSGPGYGSQDRIAKVKTLGFFEMNALGTILS